MSFVIVDPACEEWTARREASVVLVFRIIDFTRPILPRRWRVGLSVIAPRPEQVGQYNSLECRIGPSASILHLGVDSVFWIAKYVEKARKRNDCSA
jgi:hypothetical protein